MRELVYRLRRVSATAALAVALALPVPSQAIVLAFDTASTTLNVGDTFTVDIEVSGLAAAGETVTGFDLYIGLDSSALRTDAVAYGPGADAVFTGDVLFVNGQTFELGYGLLGVLGFGTDALNLSVIGFPPFFQDDDVLLATLTFTALAAGPTSLSFLPNPFAGGIPDDVKGSDFITPLNFDPLESLFLRVPEPGTIGLLAFGLLPLAWPGRRRRHRS